MILKDKCRTAILGTEFTPTGNRERTCLARLMENYEKFKKKKNATNATMLNMFLHSMIDDLWRYAGTLKKSEWNNDLGKLEKRKIFILDAIRIIEDEAQDIVRILDFTEKGRGEIRRLNAELRRTDRALALLERRRGGGTGAIGHRAEFIRQLAFWFGAYNSPIRNQKKEIVYISVNEFCRFIEAVLSSVGDNPKAGVIRDFVLSHPTLKKCISLLSLPVASN